MPEETKEQKQEFVICPCCGKLTLEKPVKVKQVDLDRYVASIVSGEMYTKTYFLYNNTVTITVADLDEQTKDTMLLASLKQDTVQDPETKDKLQLVISKLYTFLPVVTIEIAGDTPVKKDIKALTRAILKELPLHVSDKVWLDNTYNVLTDPEHVTALPKSVIDAVVYKHMKFYELMLESGFDKSFFEGIVQD